MLKHFLVLSAFDSYLWSLFFCGFGCIGGNMVFNSGWNSNLGIGSTHTSPWKFILQVYISFLEFFVLAMVLIFGYGRVFGLLTLLFLNIFQVFITYLRKMLQWCYFNWSKSRLSMEFSFFKKSWWYTCWWSFLLEILVPFCVASLPNETSWNFGLLGS